jgi:hypothetical protein
VSGRVTPASFPFYTTGEDNLRVSSYNSAAGVSLKISGRLLDTNGRATSDTWDHTPNTDRSVKMTDITLSGSTLLNITVFASAGAPQIGQTFVKVQLIRGIGAGAIVLGTILQGYVTFSQALGFPGSAIQLSQEGPGCIRNITGTAQVNGFDFSETVPTGARWELMQVFAFYHASPAIGTRYTEFRTMVGAVVTMLVGAATSIVANGNGHFQWGPNLPVFAPTDDDIRQQPIPSPTVLISGERFLAFTLNIDANDQWTGPFYKVREWIDVI